MKKVVLGVFLVLLSFSAAAVDVTASVGGVKNRVTGDSGSIARVALQNGGLGYGLQTETVANVSRNQADVSYSLADAAGVSASLGLGAVTKTGVRSHAVYLAKVGYTYKMDKFSVGGGLNYRNDFDNAILDRKTGAKVGVGYAVTNDATVDLAYERGYGDSKTNTLTLSCNKKF